MDDDSGWHGAVHNAIGGDMATFNSPIDPVFWRWHKWIDQIRSTWEAVQPHRLHLQFAAAVRVLSGVINDAPGIVMGPDGIPIHVPGGPGDPQGWLVSPAGRQFAAGLAIHAASRLVDDPAMQRRAVELASNVIGK